MGYFLRVLIVAISALIFAVLEHPLAAQEENPGLSLQGQLNFEEQKVNASFALPVAVWDGGTLPVEPITGQRVDRVWFYGATSVTLEQFTNALVSDWEAEGFERRLNCFDRACGGFDFQQALDAVPFPNRPVSVFDFLAQSWTKDGQARFILVTKTIDNLSLYRVDMATVDAGEEPQVALIGGQLDVPMPNVQPSGSWVIDGISFASGQNGVIVGDDSVIAKLVAYLNDTPKARIVLVGHSDNQGGLDVNLRLSKARAGALRDVLVNDYGIARERIDVEGVAYLAPRMANDTPEGQAANRRVEAVFLSTD